MQLSTRQSPGSESCGARAKPARAPRAVPDCPLCRSARGPHIPPDLPGEEEARAPAASPALSALSLHPGRGPSRHPLAPGAPASGARAPPRCSPSPAAAARPPPLPGPRASPSPTPAPGPGLSRDQPALLAPSCLRGLSAPVDVVSRSISRPDLSSGGSISPASLVLGAAPQEGAERGRRR